VLGRIDLAPGRYRLRLAAHNAATARDGSVFADVTVPDYAQLPVSASPAMLGATPARPSAPSGLFANLLPFVPTAERTFTRTSRVTSLVRLHQSGRQAVLPAEVTISIRDASGNVVVGETRTMGIDACRSAGEQIQSGADQAVGTRRPTLAAPTGRATASGDAFASVALRTSDDRYDLPLTRLLAGEHLLTIEAVFGTTTIRRDVRFTVE
jgi:hypothetical protein